MRFIKFFDVDIDMKIIFFWLFIRDRFKGKEFVKYERIIEDEFDFLRKFDVQIVFNGFMNSFRVYNIYLRYFRVIGFGDVRLFELVVCCLYFIEFEFFVI